MRHPGLVGPDGGHLRAALDSGRDHSFEALRQVVLEPPQRASAPRRRPTPRISAASIGRVHRARRRRPSRPARRVGICAVIASASLPHHLRRGGDRHADHRQHRARRDRGREVARQPGRAQMTTFSPRSNAVRAYSSTRSGLRDEDMIRTSCGTSNFSRIAAACCMSGSSAGDADQHPDQRCRRRSSPLLLPPRTPRCPSGDASPRRSTSALAWYARSRACEDRRPVASPTARVPRRDQLLPSPSCRARHGTRSRLRRSRPRRARRSRIPVS